ncbi:hypothetical protein LINGRAHAP2_LOCUS18626 [Linum grandiflorum]
MWNNMTLEDFFTLTEMKDGLMVSSRVHELLSVMRKEKDSIVKNIGDAIRQWTAVAGTISATENRECLDLFIQLDGLWYFDKWLKDVQNYSRGTSDVFTEESITVLLRAVEKLQIDKARSLSSGIFTTVSNLLHHSCSRVQDRARSLLDSWKQNEDSQNALDVSGNMETAKTVFLKGSDDTKRSAVELSVDEAIKSRTMNCSEVERVQDLETCNSKCVTRAILDDGNCSDKSVTESVMSNCSQTGTSLKEKISVGILDGAASTETRISSVQMGQGAEPETDAMNNASSLCDRASSVASTSSQANIQEIKADSTLAEGGDKSHNASASADNGKAAGATEGATDHMLATIDRSPVVVHSNPKDDQHLDVQSIQGDEKGSGTAGVLKSTSTIKNIGVDGDEKVGDVYACSKPALDTQSSFSTNKEKSGIVDALGVAQEVVNDRVPSGTSSSEKTMENHGKESGSPKDQARGFPEQDLSSSQNRSLKTLPDQISQLTEAVGEPEVADRGFCGFDLNEEGTSDDADLISTPISRTAAASASPAAPLQFEGTLGWKGSAATSAFHAASARKDWLDIDLNVSEAGDDKVTELMLERKSSSDIGMAKSERPCLDLNRMSNEQEAPPSRGQGLFFLQTLHHSPSPASSSSSLQKNFDLNDKPLLHGLYHGNSSHSSSLNGGSRQNEPMISIMGAKIEVGAQTDVTRKELFHQTPFMFMPNGRSKPLEAAAMEMVPTAPSYPSVPYMMYGPGGPGGPIPYMVDPRGSPMIPQIAGTSYPQQPFFMNMAGPPLGLNGAGPPLGLNGAGPSQPSSDLNLGLGGGGSSSSRGFGQFLRTNPQPNTGLGMVLGKRKEPEGGWEPYSLPYKQQIQQPPPPWR